MQVNGEKLDDQRIVEKIMQSLSVKFKYVIAVIGNGKNIFTLIVEGLMSSLCLHEQLMNKRINSTNLEQAL